jgi:hypothetical protein
MEAVLGAASAAVLGQRYVEQRVKPGVVVRLPLSHAQSWDLRAILPE